MARRQLGAGASVMKYNALDPLHKKQPTEAQVRDALAKVSAELNNDATPYFANGWKAGDFDFRLVDTTDEVVLRGTLIIERAD